jgi:hypothetical protein
MRNASKILGGNLKGKDHLRNLGIDGSTVFKWIWRK